MTIKIYHNPRCSKSRATLALLRERGFSPEVVEYLKTPPDQAELGRLLNALSLPARAMVRSGEEDYAKAGLKPDESDEHTLLQAIARWPRLLQRPIVVNGERARIGRPPEAVLEILT